MDGIVWSNDYDNGGMANFADTPHGRYVILEDFRWSFAGGPWVEEPAIKDIEEAKRACQRHYDHDVSTVSE